MLDGIRVLDLSAESGFLAGKILGDTGGDVIKLEPPGGDAGVCTLPRVDEHLVFIGEQNEYRLARIHGAPKFAAPVGYPFFQIE